VRDTKCSTETLFTELVLSRVLHRREGEREKISKNVELVYSFGPYILPCSGLGLCTRAGTYMKKEVLLGSSSDIGSGNL